MSSIQVSTQNIEAASGGNSELRNILQSIAASVAEQQDASSTSPKEAPPQASATLAFNNGSFILNINNPKAIAPLTPAQAQAQRARGINTVLSAVTPVFHQLRCASTLTFDDASNVQTFGGLFGSTQLNWTFPDITEADGQYWQVRSSYDGQTWNQWKTINSGNPLSRAGTGVALESAENMDWVKFTLRDGQLLAVGQGRSRDGGTFGLPSALYSSAMQGITSPNGYDAPEGDHFAHGYDSNTFAVVAPANPMPLTGPANYPVLLTSKMVDGEGTHWPNLLSVFAVAYDPDGKNVKQYTSTSGTWTVVQLSGGAKLCFASGKTAHGDTLVLPADLSWIHPANAITVVTPDHGFIQGKQAYGVYSAGFNTGTFTTTCQFAEGTYTWPADHANWIMFAWSPGLKTSATPSGTFVAFETPDGTKLCFGGGLVANGDLLQVADGYSISNVRYLVVPAGFVDTGHPMVGIDVCDINYGVFRLRYADSGKANTWGGAMRWMGLFWQ